MANFLATLCFVPYLQGGEAPPISKTGHLKTIGQRSGSSNRARSGRRHDRQQSNGPLAKHNREQSGPPCNRAIGSPAQSIPSVDHAGRPESCNEYDRALSGNCHNLVQSGSRPTSQGAQSTQSKLIGQTERSGGKLVPGHQPNAWGPYNRAP